MHSIGKLTIMVYARISINDTGFAKLGIHLNNSPCKYHTTSAKLSLITNNGLRMHHLGKHSSVALQLPGLG